MKKVCVLVFNFFIFHVLSSAQNSTIDSLHNLLSKVAEDINRVNVLNNLSREYKDISNEKSLECVQQALKLSEKLNYKKGMSSAWNNLGEVYSNTSNYTGALKSYFKSLELRKEMGDQRAIAGIYSNIGNVYKAQSDVNQTLYYYNLALKLRLEVGDQKEIADSYNNIGNILWKQGKLDEALKYHQAALATREQIKDKQGIAFSNNNIGGIYSDKGEYVHALSHYLKTLEILEEQQNKQKLPIAYNNIGNIYRYQNNYEEALKWFFKALAMAKENGNKNSMAQACNKIATVYDNQGKYNEALDYHLQSLKIKEEIGDKFGMGESYNNIGVMYLYQKKYEDALVYFFKALKLKETLGDKKGLINTNTNIGRALAKKNNYASAYQYLSKGMNLAREVGARDMLRDNYFVFSEAYAQQKNYTKAYEYQLLFTQLKDSILNEINSKQLNELQAKYQAEKKENEIKLLQQNEKINSQTIKAQTFQIQKRNYLIGGILLFLCSMVVVAYFGISRKNLKNKLEKEKAVRDTEEAERLRIAKDIHDDLGSGLSKINFLSEIIYTKSEGFPDIQNNSKSVSETARSLIENMRDLIWTLNPENTTLENLVARIREYSTDYFEDFSIELTSVYPSEIPENLIHKDSHREIFMAVKESLNNIAKHAKASAVTMKIEIENRNLSLSIQDNGIGFDTTNYNAGNGLRNLQHRIKAVIGELKIESKLQKGTTIAITIPLDKIIKS